MKRRELIRLLEKQGCILIRHGKKHDWYQNPDSGICQPIPRHAEILNILAKHIIKMLK